MSIRDRSFLLFPAACCFLSLCHASIANGYSDKTKPNSEIAYAKAVNLLISGRDYVQAAQLLNQTISQSPADPRYHIALGCAYADRASSLEYADSYQQMLDSKIQSYPQDLVDWRKAQLDPRSDDYGNPQPQLLKHRVYATKDDGLPLSLSDSEVKTQVRRLALDAQEQWQVGISLSSSKQSRAAAESARGWGLSLLHNFEDAFDSSSAKVTDSEIAEAFHQATIDDPSNASYLESYGFYIGRPPRMPDQAATSPEMSVAYRHSLAINPNNPGLWIRLSKYDLGYGWDSSDEQVKMAEADIKMAIRYDPNSADLRYRLAEILLDHTPYRNILNTPVPSYLSLIPQVAKEVKKRDDALASEALDQIKLGNQCPLYQKQRPDDTDVPSMMRPAWDYWHIQNALWNSSEEFADNAKLRNLARDACGYAYVVAYQGQTTKAVNAANAVIGIGNKMAGNWPYKDSTFGSGEGIQTLVAIAVEGIGYKCLQRVAEKSGDGALMNSTEDRSVEFTKRNNAFRARMKAYLSTQDESSFFDEY